MGSEILINVRPVETRVAFIENGTLTDFMVESRQAKGLAGSVCRGRISRVLPGMQAAFVDIGLERAAFLYVGDVHYESKDLDSIVDSTADEEEGAVSGSVLVAGQEGAPEEPRPPIQELIREGQSVLVQVAKDPLGTKGARITMHVSLPGRYIVFMPTVEHIGISRRIESAEERDRLRDIVEKHRVPNGGGYILRTAAEGASEESIRADIMYLETLYRDVEQGFQRRKSPGLIHTELDVELRAVRDMLTEDVEKVVVDDDETQEKVQKFVSQFMPKLTDKVSLFTGSGLLFDQYQVDLEISRALGRKVWLKSGGYIVIDEAEALVVVDVNTGSYVGKKDLEETILKTNMEAVKEISHQLRIRNCGGIIIIDFIDMEKEGNRTKVSMALEEELKRDRSKTKISEMSALGLVEMTRKRIRPSLVKAAGAPCGYCDGKGYLKSKTTVAHEIYREIERDANGRLGESTIVHCHPDVAAWIYDEESEMLDYLERKLKQRIIFKVESHFHVEQYELYGS